MPKEKLTRRTRVGAEPLGGSIGLAEDVRIEQHPDNPDRFRWEASGWVAGIRQTFAGVATTEAGAKAIVTRLSDGFFEAVPAAEVERMRLRDARGVK